MKKKKHVEQTFVERDERKVPDPLISLAGDPIRTPEEWEELRRPEIIHLFEEYVYGKSPSVTATSLRFKVIKEEKNVCGGLGNKREIEIIYSGDKGEDRFQFVLFLPKDLEKPAKTFLFINIRGYEMMDPEQYGDHEFWPVKHLLAQGYATAGFQVSEVAPDKTETAFRRAHQVFSRKKYTWGTISAWAWAASRVMDYLETDPNIASSQVAIIGHSRGGKTALWAGALDERFAFVVSNNSGSTGAAIARGKIGETIKDINTSFPYWFHDRYQSFNDREYELPVDQHMLISLIAPRPVYVTSATEDEWADPHSEFLSLTYSKPVYQQYGLKHDQIKQFPQPDSPIHDEAIAYHVRTGKHDLTLYDWQNIIRFWEADK